MIKHIVLFRISGEQDPVRRKALAKKLAGFFSPLASHPSVTEYRTGINCITGDGSWDVAIDSVFESAGKLSEYQDSPEHRKAKELASAIGKEKAVVDYEF